MASNPTLFDNVEQPEIDTTAFDNIKVDIANPVQGTTPIKTLITAAGTMNRANPNPSLDLGQQSLAAAQEALEAGEENSIRSKVALERTMRTAESLKRYKASGTVNANPALASQIDQAYHAVVSEDIQKSSKWALEAQAYENVQDMLTHGDPVEAKVTYDNIVKGGAYEVQRDNVIKNLRMAQLSAQFDKDAGQEGWGRWLVTTALGLIPGKSLIAHAGITGSQKGNPLIDAFTGTDLQNQIQTSWSLPVKDFMEKWADDGEFTQHIKSRASWLNVYDPQTAAETLSYFDKAGMSGRDKFWASLWGNIDVAAAATAVPWSRLGSVTGSLTRMGARSAAVTTAVDAMEAVAREGEAIAAVKTGVASKEIEEAAGTSLTHPEVVTEHDVPLGMDVDTHIKAARQALGEINDTNMVSRITNPDELQAAYENRLARAKEEIGNPIKDYAPMIEDLKTGESYPFSSLPNHGNYVPYMDVTFGKKSGGGFAKEATARNAAEAAGYKSAEITQAVDGQWYAKARVNVTETGFYTDPTIVPKNHFLARWYRSAARLQDQDLHAKAVTAGAQRDRLQKKIGVELKASVKGLNSDEHKGLQQILLAGQNQSKWYNEAEVRAGYERLTGKPASDKLVNSYNRYRLLNDMDYSLRNDDVYMGKAIRGMESFSFDAGGQQIAMDGHITYKPTTVPKQRVYNATEGRHYTSKNPLSQAELDHLANRGYVLIDMEQGTKLSDGSYVKKILIHKSDLDIRPLERKQIPYSSGGHRAYKDKYFGKQASSGIQPDTGTEFLTSPNVYTTFENKAQGAFWAERMNAARAYVKEGGRDAQHIEDEIFAGHKGFMSGREFIEAVDGEFINLNHPFEVNFDRELPSAYASRPDNVSLFIDEADTGFNDYYRTTGRMYYSSKGKALKTFDSNIPDRASDLAPTVDPWDALSTSLFNITRNTSLSNYKTAAIDRFVKTFRNDLNLDHLSDADKGVPSLAFEGAVRKGISAERENQIEAQRAAIKRILGYETPREKFSRQATRSLAEWALGESTGGVRKLAHDSVWWVKDANPLNKIHGFAFDSTLGLFNPGQFFVQLSTSISATALSPKYGIQGLMGAIPMHSYLISKGSENVLDTLAKRGVGKLMGFDSVDEFKMFARYMNTNGYHDVTGTHTMVQNYGPTRVFGSFANDVREAGRAPFYSAEVWNRITANRIAWGELKDQGLDPNSPLFRERLIGISDDYAFNMTSESAAHWQKGLLSIPTQFWAYNGRMIDAMLGTRFTGAQRARLIAAQLGLAGVAGVPVVDTIADYVRRRNDLDIDASPVLTTAYRGLLDSGFKYLADTDVRIGSRLGTGSFVTQTVKDLFGFSEYGEKSVVETLSGASGSIAVNSFGALADVAKYAMAETGGEAGYEITKEKTLRLATQISTINNGVKTYMVANYGYFTSRTGTVGPKDIPNQDAFMVALGFQPQEYDTAGHQIQVLNDNKEAIQDAGKQLRNWRVEAFINPDKREENMEKANTFMKLLPPDIRSDVMKSTNTQTPQSLYDKVGGDYEKFKMKQKAYKDAK